MDRSECTNAWLGSFRRLVVRYDRSLTIYGVFFNIACFGEMAGTFPSCEVNSNCLAR